MILLFVMRALDHVCMAVIKVPHPPKVPIVLRALAHSNNTVCARKLVQVVHDRLPCSSPMHHIIRSSSPRSIQQVALCHHLPRSRASVIVCEYLQLL